MASRLVLLTLASLLLSAAGGAEAADRRVKPSPRPAARPAAQPPEAVKLSPPAETGSVDWLIGRAESLLASQDYAAAIETARKAAVRAPGIAAPHVIIASALYDLRDYAGAYAEASEALTIDPSNEKAREIASVAKGRVPALATTVVERAGKTPPAPAALPLGLDETQWTVAIGLAALLVGGGLAALFLRVLARRVSPARGTASAAPGTPALHTGSYRIVREIGVGGMGHVYEAMDVHLERRVAIKTLREDIRSNPREKERFFQEARLVAALRHPNIVGIHSVVSEGEDAYIVFEYIDGHTLEQYIGHWGRLQFGHAVWVAQGAAAALDYAHSRGVVHRDLKPSNIMISSDGLLKVMDFGVARQAKESLHTLSSMLTVAGTPPYMAPEQEEGVATPKCDVYALAVCVYQMLTGSLPFKGSGPGMILQKQRKDYIPASRLAEGLPSGIDDALGWGLEPAPSMRCPGAAAFTGNLEALLWGTRAEPGKVKW